MLATGDIHLHNLTRVSNTLTVYGGKTVKVITTLQVHRNGLNHNLHFKVMSGKHYQPLLSRQASVHSNGLTCTPYLRPLEDSPQPTKPTYSASMQTFSRGLENYQASTTELSAIVFACERFNDYICGRDIIHVESNHKPPESIFKREMHLTPKRLQRMRLRLQKYPLDVRYKKGSYMYVADTLSRTYTTEDNRDPRSDVNKDVNKVDSEEMMYSDSITLSEEKLVELEVMS